MAKTRTNRVRTHIMVDEDKFAILQTILLDPKSTTSRMRYGALQSIMNRLLEAFLKKLLEPGTNRVEMLRAYGVEMEQETQNQSQKETGTDETQP